MIELDPEDPTNQLERPFQFAAKSLQYCFVCKQTGQLQECANCPRTYHYSGSCCQNDPDFFQMTANHQWFCPCCRLRNICTECSRVVEEQELVCGICSRQIHVQCLGMPMQLLIDKRKEGLRVQYVTNCHRCLQQSGIKHWMKEKPVNDKSYSLHIPNKETSNIHKSWVATEIVRAILLHQTYQLKETTTVRIALESRQAQVLNVKAPRKYSSVSRQHWLELIKEQRQNSLIGDPNNFKVCIRWIGTTYSQSTWQDVAFLPQLYIDRYFTRRSNMVPLSSVKIIETATRNEEYNRQKKQLISEMASYSLLILTEESNFSSWETILINYYPDRYISVLGDNETDRQYVLKHRLSPEPKFDMLLTTAETFKLFRRELRLNDFLIICDVGCPTDIDRLEGCIYLFKYPHFTNENLQVLFSSQKEQPERTTSIVAQPIEVVSADSAVEKPKSRIQTYTQKFIQKISKPMTERQPIRIVVKPQSPPKPEQPKKSVRHIEETNQLYVRYFKEPKELLKELHMTEAKRLVIIHFIVSFGISFQNFNQFYEKLVSCCPRLFQPDPKEQIESVRKYIQLLLAIVFREKKMSYKSPDIVALFFNYNHRSLMKHFLQLQNLKRLYEGNKGDPAKWPYNRLFLLGIKDGKHIDAQCWTSQDDLELVRLTLQFGFGNWHNIVNNFMKHRKDFQGQEYIVRRLRPNYKPKPDKTVLGWCCSMLNSRMSSMLTQLWKTEKIQKVQN